MANISEHLIKTVIHNEPKMLTGSNQKVSEQEWWLQISTIMGVASPVDRMSLNRVKSNKRNTVSPTPSHWEARPQGQVIGQRVKEDGKSECHSVMEWIGVRPGGDITPRDKRADFRRVSNYEITCRTFVGGKANDYA